MGHKSSLNKFTRFEIIESTFSDHKHIKLEINKDKISRKRTAVRKISNTLLHSQYKCHFKF